MENESSFRKMFVNFFVRVLIFQLGRVNETEANTRA